MADRPDILSERAGGCTAEVISTARAFDLLEPAWNDLLGKAGATVFQSFEWNRAWWKYKAGRFDRLHILLFRCDGEIAGIAPLFIHPVRVAGVTVARRLTFIGTGLTDYVDILADPRHEAEVFGALVRLLTTEHSSWDLFDMEDVNETSHLVTQVAGMLKEAGLNVYTYQGNVCPYVLLPERAEELFQASGPASGYNFRRKQKKLQSKFSPELRIYRSEGDNLETAIGDFSRVHGGRWKSQGYPSAFDDPAMQAYHVEFSRHFARRGWLRLYILYAGGEPVATTYNFNYRGRIYMYHSNAHGPEELMRCSPGMVVRLTSMADGIAEGMKVFDYLRGDEPYKYRETAAQESKNYLIRAVSPGRRTMSRFYLFLLTEAVLKSVHRSQREYYGYRRFVITEHPGVAGRMRFVAGVAANLLKVMYDYFYRHSPLRSVRALAIRLEGEERVSDEPEASGPENREGDGNTAKEGERP